MNWTKQKLNQLSDFIDQQYEINPFRARLVEGILAVALSLFILVGMIILMATFTPV